MVCESPISYLLHTLSLEEVSSRKGHSFIHSVSKRITGGKTGATKYMYTSSNHRLLLVGEKGFYLAGGCC